jgi:hypothetical protein
LILFEACMRVSEQVSRVSACRAGEVDLQALEEAGLADRVAHVGVGRDELAGVCRAHVGGQTFEHGVDRRNDARREGMLAQPVQRPRRCA